MAENLSTTLSSTRAEPGLKCNRYRLERSMRDTSGKAHAPHIEIALADHAVVKVSRGPTSTTTEEALPADN